MLRLFIPTILIIASLVLGFLYISPLYDKLSSTSKQEKEVDEALKNTEKIGVDAENFRAQIDNISNSDIDKLDAILPEEMDDIRFLNMLNSIASRHYIFLDRLEIISGGSGAPSRNGVLTVSFFASTSYNNFTSFLEDLEKSLVLVDINSIAASVSSQGKSSGAGLINYNVELRTYWAD